MAPNLFSSRDISQRQFFMDWGGGDDFKMIQAHCIFCAPYFSLLHQFHFMSSGIRSRSLECVCVLSCSVVSDFCDLMDSSPPGSFVHWDSPGKNTGSCSPPGDLPNPGIKPRSPAFQADFYQISHQGSSCTNGLSCWLGSLLRHHCEEKYGLQRCKCCLLQ